MRYLTLLRQDGPSLELAHQWGMPVAIVVCFTSPLALVRRKLGAPAGLAKIGSLVEAPGFYPYLSGRENLKVVADFAGVSHKVQNVDGSRFVQWFNPASFAESE